MFYLNLGQNFPEFDQCQQPRASASATGRRAPHRAQDAGWLVEIAVERRRPGPVEARGTVGRLSWSSSCSYSHIRVFMEIALERQAC